MKKLQPQQDRILYYIDQAGGSYCPDDDIHPEAAKALRDLVKSKRLRTEETDAGPRYHLTAQGRADAEA